MTISATRKALLAAAVLSFSLGGMQASLFAADLKEKPKAAKAIKLPGVLNPEKDYTFAFRFNPSNEKHVQAVLLMGGFLLKDKRNGQPYHDAMDEVFHRSGRDIDDIASQMKERLKDKAFKEQLASVAEALGRGGQGFNDVLGDGFRGSMKGRDGVPVFDRGLEDVGRTGGPGSGGAVGGLFGNREGSGMRDTGYGHAMSGETEVRGSSSSYKHSNGKHTSGSVQSEWWVQEGGRSSHYKGESTFDGHGNVNTVVVVEQTDASGRTSRSEKTVKISSDGTKQTTTKTTTSDGKTSEDKKTEQVGGGREDEGSGFQLTPSQETALRALAGNFRGPFAKQKGMAGGVNDPRNQANTDNITVGGSSRDGTDKRETVGGNYGPDGKPLQTGGSVNKDKLDKGNVDPVKQ